MEFSFYEYLEYLANYGYCEIIYELDHFFDKEIYMTDYLKNSNIKIGDTICLNYTNSGIVLIDYLKHKKDSIYHSINIIPIEQQNEWINTPVLLAGFETQIKELKEEDNILFAYTNHLRINLKEALKTKEITKLKKEDIQDENQFSKHKYLITNIQEINNNFCYGLTTSIEKNAHLFHSLSDLLSFLYHNNPKIRMEVDKDKPNAEETDKVFAYSWQKMLDSEKFQRDQIGFLYHQKDEEQKKFVMEICNGNF